jgi:hypothetical protein
MRRLMDPPNINLKITIVLLSNNWVLKFNKRRRSIDVWQIMKFKEYICESISQLLRGRRKDLIVIAFSKLVRNF